MNVQTSFQGKEFTPYDLAVIKGYSETADYLKSKGVLPRGDVTKAGKTEEESIEKTKESQEIKKTASTKATSATKKAAVVKANTKGKKEKDINKDKKDKNKDPDEQNKFPTKTEDAKPGVIENGTLSTVVTTQADKSVGIEKDSKSVDPAQTTATKETLEKGQTVQVSNAYESAADKSQTVDVSNASKEEPNKSQSVNGPKVDPIKSSRTSLQRVKSPKTKDAVTQDNKVTELDRGTSPMGQTNTKKKPEHGNVLTIENNEETIEGNKPGSESKKPGKRGKVGFDNTAVSDNEDSGNETDQSRYRYKKIHTNRKLHSSNKKAYVDNVKNSVQTFQRKRNTSRSLQQLRRAQIHTGPMHDIVMFSKMMDHYRQGLGPEETEVDLRQYANWDGYLNGECKY